MKAPLRGAGRALSAPGQGFAVGVFSFYSRADETKPRFKLSCVSREATWLLLLPVLEPGQGCLRATNLISSGVFNFVYFAAVIGLIKVNGKWRQSKAPPETDSSARRHPVRWFVCNPNLPFHPFLAAPTQSKGAGRGPPASLGDSWTLLSL